MAARRVMMLSSVADDNRYRHSVYGLQQQSAQYCCVVGHDDSFTGNKRNPRGSGLTCGGATEYWCISKEMPELNTPLSSTCQQPRGYRVERVAGSKWAGGASSSPAGLDTR